MSIQYDKKIFSNGSHTLKLNFAGIKDSIVTVDDLTMSIYAYDSNGLPKFSEILNFEEIKELYEHLNQISIIKESSQTTSGKFIETNSGILKILNDLKEVNPNILKTILNKFSDDDKLKKLLEALSEEDEKGNNPLDILSGLQKQQGWQIEIENLEALLQLEDGGNIVDEIKNHVSLKPYIAAQPEKIFQNWIENNIKWIFGVEYIKKHDVRKIALYSEADLLMESMDGFLDLIELKRPTCEMFKYDSSHKSYYLSPDLSKVIGQCLYYMEKLDDLKMNLQEEYKVKIIRPRIKIVAGRTKDFNQKKYNALRMLNSNLNNIEIISYDYLLKCGGKMIANYK